MLRVVELRSPSLMRVSVFDLLKVPPSWALALAWSFIMLGLSTILLLEDAFPSTVAAEPAPRIVDEVPDGLVDCAPRPIVLADVPPAAAEPPLPTVALPVCARAACAPAM